MASMLERLPDELILEIFRHLRPARLLVHASYRPEHEIYSAGISRDTSVATFASLCLTTKHLGLLATPELYGNLIESEASRELHYMPLPGQVSRSGHYLRQFFEFCEAIVRRPSLGQHLRYVNHSVNTVVEPEPCRTYALDERWSSHRKAMKRLASRIWGATQLQVWTELFVLRPEQAQFVLLLALAPNVTHIVTDIYANALSTILSLLGLDNSPCEKQRSRIHEFSRLERIIITMGLEWSSFSEVAPVRHFIPQIASLRHFQQNFAHLPATRDSVLRPHIVMTKLETLILHDCTKDLELVAATVGSCLNLKSFILSQTDELG